MSDQIQDKYFYKNEEYSLIEPNGTDLFSPEEFGLEPVMMHTGCWNGYYAKYEIADDALYLKELTLCDRNGKYPSIDGVIPVRAFTRPDILPRNEELKREIAYGKTAYIAEGPSKYMNTARYANMSYKLPFTGNIRLAKNIIKDSASDRDLYNLLFNREDMYRTVLDFTVDHGRVVRIVDRSK